MGTQQMFGIKRTIPPFRYRVYKGSRLVSRKFDGSVSIVEAYYTKYEAEAALDRIRKKINAECRGGYMMVHEYDYFMTNNARHEIIPVDVTFADANAQELILQS